MIISQFQFNEEDINILYESLRRRRFYALGREDRSDKDVFDDVAKIDALMSRLKPECNSVHESWDIEC